MKLENAFVSYLHNEPDITSEGAIYHRVRKLGKAENILGIEADDVVADDSEMYQAIKKLKLFDNEGGAMQNALRKYYAFINGKDFPRILLYEKQMGIKDDRGEPILSSPITLEPMDGYNFFVIITKKSNSDDSSGDDVYQTWVMCEGKKEAYHAYNTIDKESAELTPDGIRMLDQLGTFDLIKRKYTEE